MRGREKRNAPVLLGFWSVLLVAGIVIWLCSFGWHDGNRPARALLIDFLYFAPLCAGFTAWSAGLALSNARWAGPLETTLLKGVGFALPSIIALGGLWIGARSLYPWATGKTVEGAWLYPNFVFTRDLALLAVFWIVAFFYTAQRRRGKGGRSGALLSILYMVVFSMIAFDLNMSITPPWKSTVYGMYFVVSGLYIAIAAWTFSAVFDLSVSKKQLHDLGKLIVGMSILAVYLMFCQVLTIWYANLPSETLFLLRRIYPASWSWISFALTCTVYLGPLVLLLPKNFKQQRWYLGSIAALVLAGMWLERFWLVVPSTGALPVIGAPEIAMTAAFIGALGIVFTFFKPQILASHEAESQSQ